ncbi:MAG: M20/M25/M40 family metallo-hydrolase [Conexivisphaerales archaeon]
MTSRIISATDSSPLLDVTKAPVMISSVNPPSKERAVVYFIASWFEKRGGYQISNVEVGRDQQNVMITKENSLGRSISVDGHMDVIPAEDGWLVNAFGGQMGARMYGRGVADMKGTLAAMVIAIDALNKVGNSLHGSITLVDEERGGILGSSSQKRYISFFEIVGEPTSSKVATTHKGNLTF